MNLTSTSKYLSLILRHKPEAAGVTLDEHGWANVDGELETLAPEKRSSAVAHLYSVSLAVTMIAQKRGLDAELLSLAAMLHDLYAYKSGSYDDHAHKDADVIHHCMNDLSKPVKDKERARFDSLCAEFGMASV